MDVIGVGFGRTGTASLKLALEQLGFGPCYHMREVMDRPDRARQWRRVGEGVPADWDELFGGFRATVDWPGAAYWRELVDAYPDAKVVLTVRDVDKWFDSAASTIFRFPMRRHNAVERLLYRFLCLTNPASAEVPLMLDKVLWQREFGDRPLGHDAGSKAYAVDAYRRHVAEVIDYVPADRLLVYEVKQGWQPLCEFLERPVPDGSFPRVNETEEFNRDIDSRRWSSIRPVLLSTLGVAAAGVLAGVAVAPLAGAGLATAVGVAVAAIATGLAIRTSARVADRRAELVS